MKNILAFVLALSLFSCKKEEVCTFCFLVAYSDENKKCGRTNNGTEEISRMPLGEVCESDREEVRKSIEKVTTVRSACGATYTLTTKFECY